MKTILRLESRHRCGVFSTPSTGDVPNDEYSTVAAIISQCVDLMKKMRCGYDGSRHPSPYEDTLLWNQLKNYDKGDLRSFFFGFVDERAFRSWFYSDELLYQLDSLGVTLVCYRVTERLDGNTQSVARKVDKTQENELWRISLLEFLVDGLPKMVDKPIA